LVMVPKLTFKPPAIDAVIPTTLGIFSAGSFIPENTGAILALVTLKLADAPVQGLSVPIQTIGIELYTPLPDGVAVGARFAPSAVKVPGMREFDLKTAIGQPR
jgi:hypothetical protein